jgi:hypothetical protein
MKREEPKYNEALNMIYCQLPEMVYPGHRELPLILNPKLHLTFEPLPKETKEETT